MREAKYSGALEVLSRISVNSFKTASQKSDYYWQQLLCHVGMGNETEALSALKAYLDFSAEDPATLKSNVAQLSPKIVLIIDKYLARQKR